MSPTSQTRLEIKCGAAGASQIPPARRHTLNSIKIERPLGNGSGAVERVRLGNLAETMHMEFGTLPASQHASESLSQTG
jgi:hypothetical protein